MYMPKNDFPKRVQCIDLPTLRSLFHHFEASLDTTVRPKMEIYGQATIGPHLTAVRAQVQALVPNVPRGPRCRNLLPGSH